VTVKQQLAEFYLNEKQFTQIPALRLADRLRLRSPWSASVSIQNYQEFMPQLGHCSVPLRRWRVAELVELTVQGQIDEALETSQILLQADQRASNFYGLMNTYDQIGQLYLKRGNNSEALAAFQKGLNLLNNWIINRLTLLNRFRSLQ